MHRTNAKILIVQDDHRDAVELEECLEGLGYTVCATVASGGQAIKKTEEMRPDLALIDLGLEGDVNGIEAAEQIGSRFSIPVVYLIDDVQENLLQRTRTSHTFGYVLQPFEQRQLHLNIRTALSLHEGGRKHRETEARLERTVTEQKNQIKLMETIFNSVSDGVVVTDRDGKFLLINPSAERIGGMGVTDAPLDQWSETYGIFYPDEKTPCLYKDLPFKRYMRGEELNDLNLFIRNQEKPEGTHINVNSRPLLDDSGIVQGTIIVFRDFTNLKAAESKLRRTVRNLQDQAQLLETVVNSISDGVVATDEEGGFLVFNPSAKRIAGKHVLDSQPEERSEIYGLFLPDKETLFPPEELPLWLAAQGKSTDGVEIFIRNQERPEGVYISVNGRPLLDNSGTTIGGVIVFRDVTELKESERRLKQSAESLQMQTKAMETIFNSISDGVVAADENGKFTIFNPSAERMVGIGMTEEDPDQRTNRYGIFFPDRETPFPVEDLPLVRAIRGEASDKTKIVFNSISDGMVVAEDGKFTIFNPGAERMVDIGMTEEDPDQWTNRYGIFFPDRETSFPVEELPLLRAIRGEASDEIEMFIRSPKVPQGVYISVSGRPLQDNSGMARGGVIVFRDVTKRVQAEEAMAQAFAQGRLEVLDTVLHNIGNAINSVAIGVGTIHQQLTENVLMHRCSALTKAIEAHRDDWIPYLQTDPQGQKVRPFIFALAKDFAAQNARLIETIERVNHRVAYIVGIIRTQGSFETQSMLRKDINLLKGINDAVRLVQDSLTRKGIQILVDCQNAPKEIRIHESRFHQMLVNLIKNAIEAIDGLAKSSGLEAKPHIQIRSCVEENCLLLDVIDNGIGIEEKDFKAIFNAGYTTKETGSGLGLHSAANFVIGSGGQIYPLSAGAGKGTTMRIKLRLSSVALQSENKG